MSVRVIDERKSVRIINEVTRVVSRPGTRGDRGPSGTISGAVIDLTDFEYLGVDYGMVAGVEVDQDAALMAGFAKAAAGDVKTLYLPEGDYALSWQTRASLTRLLPAGVKLIGDGRGKTILHAMASTFTAAVGELGTGGMLQFASRTLIRGITFDGRYEDIVALGAAAINRRTNLVESQLDTLTEGWDNIDCEFTGEYANETAAVVLTSNTTGDYQFTLSPGHGIEPNDEIYLRGHTGATFTRATGGTTAGNGRFLVTSVDGDDIRVVLSGTLEEIVVTVGGTGGSIDNTVSKAVEGFGLNLTMVRDGRVVRPYAHHNQGTGIALVNPDKTQTEHGHSVTITDPICEHNGWQGIGFWGFRDSVVIGARCNYNDKNGCNTEYSDNIRWLGATGNYNGRAGFRAVGYGTQVVWADCHADGNGAVDFEASFGALQFPNDPDVMGTGAFTGGVNYHIGSAIWSRTPFGVIGPPKRVVMQNCTSNPAPGKFDIRASQNDASNTEYGSQTELIINSPQAAEWRFHPQENDAGELDAGGNILLGIRTKWPLRTVAQRLPVPPLPEWITTSGTTNHTPTGTYTTGLTSTAGAATVIAWTAHGFVTGNRVLLDSFTGAGAAKLNRPEPHVVTRIDANSFSVAVASTSNGSGGRGIDVREEIAGMTSTQARTIEFDTGVTGYRWDIPWASIPPGTVWPFKYKVIISDNWWTAGVTTTPGPGDLTTVTWPTAHGRATKDRVIFEDMAGSDDININDELGFRIVVTGTDTFTIDLATTDATSGGRAAFVADIPILEAGIRDAGSGGAVGNHYPSIHQPFTPGDWYTPHDTEIRAEPHTQAESLYRLSIALLSNPGSLAGHKLVIDSIGPLESPVVMAKTATDYPQVVTASFAYAGETGIGSNANGVAQNYTLTGTLPGDIVLVDLDSLAGLGASIIIAHVHAADSIRIRLRNLSGISLNYPAGTFFVTVFKYPR